jgi:hypothetical protein
MKPFMIEEIMRYNSASDPALFVAAFDRPAVAAQVQQQSHVPNAGMNHRKDSMSQLARRDSGKGQFLSQHPAACSEQGQQPRYSQQQKVLGGSNQYSNVQQEERMQCGKASSSSTHSQTKPTPHALTSSFSHSDFTHFAAPQQQQQSAYRSTMAVSTSVSMSSGSLMQSGVGVGTRLVSTQGCYDGTTSTSNSSFGARMQMNKEEMRNRLKALLSRDRVLPAGWNSCETAHDHALPRRTHAAMPFKKQRV